MGDRASTPPGATVIGGFLGAGKTTLLNALLSRHDGVRFAVLVNDFGALNVDAELIAEATDDVLSLKNGCICCTIKNDLFQTLIAVLERPEPVEHILIEASGISDPGVLTETFLDFQRRGALRLDGVIAVVDCEHFLALEGPEATLGKCQVLAADLILLSKLDLASSEQIAATRAKIHAIHPEARVVDSDAEGTHLDALLAIERPETSSNPQETVDAAAFTSWTFIEAAPLSFRALVPIVRDLPEGVLRIKGFVSLAERPGDRLVLHVAGRRTYVRTVASGSPASGSNLVLIARTEGLNRAEIDAALRKAAVS